MQEGASREAHRWGAVGQPWAFEAEKRGSSKAPGGDAGSARAGQGQSEKDMDIKRGPRPA